MSPEPPVVDDRAGPVEYYGSEAVRRQVRAYCGACGAGGTPAAAFVAGMAPGETAQPQWETVARVPPDRVGELMARGCDITRSLWDREHLVFLIDLDYQHVDDPAAPFLRPAETFVALEPVYGATMRVLQRFGIHTPPLATGRGYHFAGRIRLDSPLARRLADLLPRTPPWFATVDRRRPPDVTASLSAEHARAADGLGLVLEWAAHQIYVEAQADSQIPVVVNGTHVGAGRYGRQCVSIDFSHAGDPLDSRHMRVAFGAYQWHRARPDIFGPIASTSVAPLAVIPRGNDSVMTLLARGRGLAEGLRAAAASADDLLPDIAPGLEKLADAYAASALAAFHRQFYAERQAGVATPDAALDRWPPCLALPLRYPNDLLLRPEFLQHLIRGLMARGWRPSAIAELIRSRYEADYGWGDRWRARMDPESRAEFEVRVFAGLVATRVDPLIDFNCVSAQEKDLCPRVPCAYDLRLDRAMLWAERS